MRLRVLVVDDEPLARDGLKLLLGRQPRVASVSEARNGREAVALIREQKPDLVLLDVQMPRTDGFAVVQAIGAERMPAVIFVTAHDQYAIRAFEIAAIDYLLKPVSEERFALAFERAIEPAARRAARGEPAPGAGDARCHRQPAAAARAIRDPVRRAHHLRASRRGGLDRSAPELRPTARGPATHLLHVPMNTIEAVLDPSASCASIDRTS